MYLIVSYDHVSTVFLTVSSTTPSGQLTDTNDPFGDEGVPRNPFFTTTTISCSVGKAIRIVKENGVLKD